MLQRAARALECAWGPWGDRADHGRRPGPRARWPTDGRARGRTPFADRLPAVAPVRSRGGSHGHRCASLREPDIQIVDLTLRSGASYRYFAVPLALVEQLLAAEWKGVFFSRYIKNSYPYQRLR